MRECFVFFIIHRLSFKWEKKIIWRHKKVCQYLYHLVIFPGYCIPGWMDILYIDSQWILMNIF